jgi:hypothetical protein
LHGRDSDPARKRSNAEIREYGVALNSLSCSVRQCTCRGGGLLEDEFIAFDRNLHRFAFVDVAAPQFIDYGKTFPTKPTFS